MAITITDYTPDASWRFRIEAEVDGGGRFVLGAVDTIQPSLLRIRNPNRIIAIVSVPGIRNWYVYSELLRGTPLPGKSEIYADLEVTKAEEYAAGCCPLVAIPGVSIDVNAPSEQSSIGAPVVAPRITLYTGSGWALWADVAYLGEASGYVQFHDAGASDPIGDATMNGLGLPFASTPFDAQTQRLPWQPGRRFRRGFTLATSSSQNNFVAQIASISAFANWRIDREE